MLVLNNTHRFTHTVSVMLPIDGGYSEEEFKATFEVVGVDDLGDTSTLDGQVSLLRRVVVGLDDILDGQEKPVSYSEELRDRLIDIPYIRAGLLRSYLGAVTRN